MICKKCKTAAAETDTRCPNCGAPLGSYANHRFWLAALVLLMMLIVLSIYYMNAHMRIGQTEAAASASPTADGSQPPVTGGVSGVPAGMQNTSEAHEPSEPVFTPDPGKSESEIEQIVKNTASAAEKYRGAYSQTSEFVSKNGLLYDFPAEMYISVKDFTAEDGFNADYSDEDVMILYVKAADMPADMTEGMPADQLAVFAAFPYADTYIFSNGIKTTSMPADDMKGILERYGADHGQILYVRDDTATFAGAITALESSPGLNGPLDVRYMAEDGKYVSAVVSLHSAPTAIREFILQKTDGGLKIYIDNIETYWQKFVAINTAAPDVNLDLVPAYNLCRDAKNLKTDFTALLGSMFSSGIASKDDGDPIFISGNDEFVFMEFANGMHMLAHNDDGYNDWKVYQVSRYEDAVLRMQELSKFNPPPYFIIKQN